MAANDRVALEITGNAGEIARILAAHVASVVVVSPNDTGISRARAKTDRLDARTLAKLLAAGELDAVWMPDEWTRSMRRRLSRRSQLVRSRTRAKNEIHAALIRRLQGRPPVSDLFGVNGRKWLAELVLPADETETIAGCLRHVDFLDAEIAQLDRAIARDALGNPHVLRLMTVPGVSVITASTFIAAIGEVERFPSACRLVGYLGLDPRVRQSGSTPARHGHISKQGSAAVRHVLVEAALIAARAPGPLRAFYERVRARRGAQSRCRRHRPQARRPVLVAAHPPTGLRLRPALIRAPEDPPARAHRRRLVAQRPGPRRPRRPQPGHPQRRTRHRPAGRERLPAHDRRLEGHRTRQSGRGRDTGARISKALEGQSRAAGHKPLTPALRYVSRPRPPNTIPQEPPGPLPLPWSQAVKAGRELTP